MAEELTPEELEEQGSEQLPEREEMSLINANLAAPVNAAVAANVLSDGSIAYAMPSKTWTSTSPSRSTSFKGGGPCRAASFWFSVSLKGRTYVQTASGIRRPFAMLHASAGLVIDHRDGGFRTLPSLTVNEDAYDKQPKAQQHRR